MTKAEHKKRKLLKSKIKEDQSKEKIGRCNYILDKSNPFDKFYSYDLEHDIMDMYHKVLHKR